MLEMLVGDEYAPTGKALICLISEDGIPHLLDISKGISQRESDLFAEKFGKNILASGAAYSLFGDETVTVESVIKTAFADTKDTDGRDIVMYHPSRWKYAVEKPMIGSSFNVATNSYKLMIDWAKTCRKEYDGSNLQELRGNYSYLLFMLSQLSCSIGKEIDTEAEKLIYFLGYVSRRLGEPYLKNAMAELEKMGIPPRQAWHSIAR